MKNSKKMFLQSVLVLCLCVAMLIGSTFAWFSDNVTSRNNVITAGNLDLKMYWTDDLDNGEWYSVEDDEHNTIFNYDNWEPGYTDVKYIKLVNAGELALNYQLSIMSEGKVGKLAEVIDVWFVEDATKNIVSREELVNLTSAGTLSNVMNGKKTSNGSLMASEEVNPFHNSGETIIAIAMKMQEGAGNEYQNQTIGDGFSITAVATQNTYEEDSFGKDYDIKAEFPQLNLPAKATAIVSSKDSKIPTTVKVGSEHGIYAMVPAGVTLENGTGELILTVKEKENSDSNITVVNNEILTALDVHIEGISEDNTVPIVVDLGNVLPKGLNLGNYTFSHVEDGQTVMMTAVSSVDELDEHNQFYYESATGKVVISVATFSEVAMTVDTDNPWNGATDITWYNTSGKSFEISSADALAGFAQIVSGEGIVQDSFKGKTVKLASNISLTKDNDATAIFYPIGYWKKAVDESGNLLTNKAGKNYYTYGGAFEGIFDGDQHKIQNLNQNGWSMIGKYDAGYFKEALGLFGYINGGTVKNLVLNNFEMVMEFAPMGCVTAYGTGECTFENITLTNCNPQTYNTGVAGIVGWDNGGDTEADKSRYTFNNIQIDESNKMTALWGSWDVAAGGIMGYLGKYSTADFAECNIGAVIDVYNDVCGNYQYYWYRYSGMFIGTVDRKTADSTVDTTGITAKDCVAKYGDWRDYYYCELIKNTKASYTHDYQFSRLNRDGVGDDLLVFDGEGIANCEHTGTDGNKWTHEMGAYEETDIDGDGTIDNNVLKEDKTLVYLPFNQLFGGYSWGVRAISSFEGIVCEQPQKFAKLFNNESFLYRVGNQNEVKLGSLFGVYDNNGTTTAQVDSENVEVTIEPVNGLNVSGTYTKNTDDWKISSIQLSGTGVVKVTISEAGSSEAVYLEVVDGYNVTTYGELKNRNSVLLNEITMSSGGSYYLSGGATLYGNGFTFDVSKGAYTGTKDVSSNYVVGLTDASLDNVQIIGAVYKEYGGMASSDYNRATVLTQGNCRIINSYISNCASPIRINRGELEIVSSTLKGGNFANLDIRNGDVILDKVTTINQADGNDLAEDGTTVVGLGIVGYYEGVTSAKIEVKNGITQYNNISSNDEFSHDYAKQFVGEMFGSNHTSIQYKDGNATWVNTGIVSMNNVMRFSYEEYETDPVNFMGKSGWVYTTKPTANSISENPPTYKTLGQGTIAPEYEFDYTSKNYIKKTENSNDYCYYDNGKVLIAMDEGDSFSWDPFIFEAKKVGKTLGYSVSMNGKTYNAGEKITFNQSGDYEVLYTYTDDNNYKLENGKPVTFDHTYTKSVHINVSVIKPAAQHAIFTFGSNNTLTEKKTVGNNTYIVPSGVTSNNADWGYITISGEKIYYPITEAYIKKSLGRVTAYFYVFEDVVTIIDYSDGGTGSAVTYNSSTKTMPSNLSVVKGYYGSYSSVSSAVMDDTKLVQNGPENTFKYYASSTASASTTTQQNYLCYASPGNLNTSGRGESITIAQYKYIDNAGATYYYYVGYHMEDAASVSSDSSSGCFTEGTLITLADGSRKQIEEVTYTDKLLAWDLNTGKYVFTTPSLIESHDRGEYRIINLNFADGTVARVVVDHGFFNVEENKFVFLDESNVDSYIGHKFVKVAENETYQATELVGYSITVENIAYYTIQTAIFNNCIAENMFTLTSPPEGVDGWFDYFKIGEDLKYDAREMQAEIEKYGLYSYEDFKDYVTYEQFVAFNGPYLKVLVGRGVLTYEDILNLIATYVK